MCDMCGLQARGGGRVSIENPKGSYFWKCRWLAALTVLCEKLGCPIFMAVLCQCAFGLRLPGFPKHCFCKKDIIIAANFKGITALSRNCPGVSSQHQHAWAWGCKRVDGKSIRLTAAAGRYPALLCAEWSDVIAGELLC